MQIIINVQSIGGVIFPSVACVAYREDGAAYTTCVGIISKFICEVSLTDKDETNGDVYLNRPICGLSVPSKEEAIAYVKTTMLGGVISAVTRDKPSRKCLDSSNYEDWKVDLPNWERRKFLIKSINRIDSIPKGEYMSAMA